VYFSWPLSSRVGKPQFFFPDDALDFCFNAKKLEYDRIKGGFLLDLRWFGFLKTHKYPTVKNHVVPILFYLQRQGGGTTKHEEGWFQPLKGSIAMMQGGGFATELGGITEVTNWTWLCTSLLIGLWGNSGLVPNHVLLVLGNEDKGRHHIQCRQTQDLGIDLRKHVCCDLTIHQIFNRD
jgi:hypothetical protein